MVREFENKNQWAIILGGSSGLGLATAHKLAQHGLNLCIVHRTRRQEMTAIDDIYTGISNKSQVRVITYNKDATKSENRNTILDDLNTEIGIGKIKCLIHSIAKGNLKPMISDDKIQLNNDDFRLTIDSMAISLYDWFRAIHTRQMFSEDSRILSFTSEGNTKAWKNYAAVSAAKVTLEAITRSIALESAPYGIKANCIQAGITDTASLRMIPGSEELIDHAIKRNPYKRLTTPEDVANVVYLLMKDEARWINGTIIPVNGGEHLL
jgi:enoyl-[acyl-carrier protein] reductase I